MEVDYFERKEIASENGCTLTIEIHAAHYFHRTNDLRRTWNEKRGLMLHRAIMKGPTGEHVLQIKDLDRRGEEYTISDRARILAHWRGFCGNPEANFRMPRENFKRTYYSDY